MARQKMASSPKKYKRLLPGRRVVPEAWKPKQVMIDGVLCDVTPAPGNTYNRDTWPPRGRGRGESLTSVRRISAKLRCNEAYTLRTEYGYTWEVIANKLGYRDASGPYRAVRRALDKFELIERERQQRKEERE